MNSEITLHDYHLAYPRTVSVPTITQRGLIRSMLERQRCKADRAARRRATRKQLAARAARTFRTIFLNRPRQFSLSKRSYPDCPRNPEDKPSL